MKNCASLFVFLCVFFDMASSSLASPPLFAGADSSMSKPEDVASTISDGSFQLISEGPTYSAEEQMVDLLLSDPTFEAADFNVVEPQTKENLFQKLGEMESYLEKLNLGMVESMDTTEGKSGVSEAADVTVADGTDDHAGLGYCPAPSPPAATSLPSETTSSPLAGFVRASAAGPPEPMEEMLVILPSPDGRTFSIQGWEHALPPIPQHGSKYARTLTQSEFDSG